MLRILSLLVTGAFGLIVTLIMMSRAQPLWAWLHRARAVRAGPGLLQARALSEKGITEMSGYLSHDKTGFMVELIQ